MVFGMNRKGIPLGNHGGWVFSGSFLRTSKFPDLSPFFSILQLYKKTSPLRSVWLNMKEPNRKPQGVFSMSPGAALVRHFSGSCFFDLSR